MQYFAPKPKATPHEKTTQHTETTVYPKETRPKNDKNRTNGTLIALKKKQGIYGSKPVKKETNDLLSFRFRAAILFNSLSSTKDPGGGPGSFVFLIPYDPCNSSKNHVTLPSRSCIIPDYQWNPRPEQTLERPVFYSARPITPSVRPA